MKKEKAYMLGVAQTSFRKEYKKKKKKKKAESFFGWLAVLVGAAALMMFLFIDVSVCFDDGMEGTVSEGDFVISNRAAYMLKDAERGDVISFRYEDEAGNVKVLQRRVVAFPGETVEIDDGVLYIDGAECIEDYAFGELSSDVDSVVVPESTYYVLSDNRDVGPDSSDGLYVKWTSIVGKELVSVSF